MSTIKRIATGAVALGTLAAGCHSTQPQAKEAEAPVAKEEAPVTVPANESTMPPKHGVDLAGLQGRTEWSAFKALWRQLDDDPSPTGLGTANSADAARGEALAKVVPGVEKLAEEGLLHESHARLLNGLLGQRIGYLAGDCDRLMVMHRMPMPHETAACDASRNLEMRIDTLVALRNEGKMADATFEVAMKGVIEQVELAVLTQMFGAEIGSVSLGPPRTAAQLMDSIRKSIAEMSEEASAVLRTTLSDTEEALPGLRILAADLETQ